jgi:predicted nucleic acid-binding Zn ribbon protein
MLSNIIDGNIDNENKEREREREREIIFEGVYVFLIVIFQ